MKEPLQYKIFDILKNWRFILLVFVMFLSFITIGFNVFESKGKIVIEGVSINSLSERSGMSFNSEILPTNYEVIEKVNENEINSVESFIETISNIKENQSLKIYTSVKKEGYVINFTKKENQTNLEALGLNVKEKAKSNIRLGIELEGGSRLILKPTANLTEEKLEILVQSLQNRLNIYGVSGTKVNLLKDSFSNDNFILVESTSSNKNEVLELLKQKGEFEAKIGNSSVFIGKNVIKVYTDPQNSRVTQCNSEEGGYVCSFSFLVNIDEEGSQKMFDIAKELEIVEGYLSEKISFYLDENQMDELNIGSIFKVKKINNPSISISNEKSFKTQKEAIEDIQKKARILQTILSTDTLPSGIEIVQSTNISTSKGQEFLSNVFLIGTIALLLVASIVALRYKKISIFLAISFALISELVVVFGLAALLKITIDLSAIGGLIAAIGTGVDDQIIITDEYFRKEKKYSSSKKKIKDAFYVVIVAFLTTFFAMLPLMFAGLKIIQGFAFMILIGITIGVFLTRPCYSQILRIIMTTRKERKEESKEEE